MQVRKSTHPHKAGGEPAFSVSPPAPPPLLMWGVQDTDYIPSFEGQLLLLHGQMIPERLGVHRLPRVYPLSSRWHKHTITCGPSPCLTWKIRSRHVCEAAKHLRNILIGSFMRQTGCSSSASPRWVRRGPPPAGGRACLRRAHQSCSPPPRSRCRRAWPRAPTLHLEGTDYETENKQLLTFFCLRVPTERNPPHLLNKPLSHRWAPCGFSVVPRGPVQWGCSGRGQRGETWQTLLCRGAPGGRGWVVATTAAATIKGGGKMQRFRKKAFHQLPDKSLLHRNNRAVTSRQLAFRSNSLGQ